MQGGAAAARGAVVVVLLVRNVVGVAGPVMPAWILGHIAAAVMADRGPMITGAGADGAAVWRVRMVMVMVRVVDLGGVVVPSFPRWGPRPSMVSASMLTIDLMIVVSIVILAIVVVVVMMVIDVSSRINFVEIVVVQLIVKISFDHELIPILFNIFLHLVTSIPKILVAMKIERAALGRDDCTLIEALCIIRCCIRACSS